jgi:hypothetical protein
MNQSTGLANWLIQGMSVGGAVIPPAGKKNMENETKQGGRSGLRIFLSVFLVIVLIGTIILAVIVGPPLVAVVATAKAAKSVTEPIGDLVRQLVAEATPVILPNPVVIVKEINSLARLETTSYSFQDVIQIERNNDLLWGAFGESMLFVAYGDVIAGVDLAKLGPDDLQVTGPESVMVFLPEAEIFVTDLDNQRSYVADRDIGLFTDANTELETTVRREAESRMLEAAYSNGIIEQAQSEGERFIFSFLEGLGFTDVTFVDSQPPPVAPYVQEVPKGFALTPAPPAISTPVPVVP